MNWDLHATAWSYFGFSVLALLALLLTLLCVAYAEMTFYRVRLAAKNGLSPKGYERLVSALSLTGAAAMVLMVCYLMAWVKVS